MEWRLKADSTTSLTQTTSGISSSLALLTMQDKIDEFRHGLRRALKVFCQHGGSGSQG